MSDDEVLGAPADVLGLLARIVVPVLKDMTRQGEEPEAVALAWEGLPPSHGRSDLLLTVTIHGEVFRSVLLTDTAPALSDAEARARLASDFQDFVAESRFARGELRTYSGE